jgi:hypothetical protein
MEVLNNTEPFAQVDFHSTLRDSDINDKDYQTYLEDWKTKGFPNRWEYLKYYNINAIEIMISPIYYLIKTFFQWKVDMFANITLASIAQYIKFKLLYDDLVRTHPLKRSSQPVIITFHGFQTGNSINKKKQKIEKEKKKDNNNTNNNNNVMEYEYIIEDESSDEDDNTNLFDFSNTFSLYFKERQQSQEEKEENEISINMENLHIQPQVFLPFLSPEQLVEVTHTCFKITGTYMWSKTKSYFYQDKKVN